MQVLASLLLLSSVVGIQGLPRTPSGDKEPPYLELAEKIAEEFMKRQGEGDNDVDERTLSKAERMMNAYNRMSDETRDFYDQSQKREIELDTLALLALGEGETDNVMKDLSTLGLTKRIKGQTDDTCNTQATCDSTAIYRTPDGTCNNQVHTYWGSTGMQHIRLLPNAYADGNWKIRDKSVTGTKRNPVPLRPAREISNKVHRHDGEAVDDVTPANPKISQMLWAFGQFFVHDIIKTPDGLVKNFNCCAETDKKLKPFCMPIKIDAGDVYFTNGICMPAKRSAVKESCDGKILNQFNEVTSFVDASNVYGSNKAVSDSIRSFTAGFLEYTTGEFPPNDTASNVTCDRQETGYCSKTERMLNPSASLVMSTSVLKALPGEWRSNVVPSLTTLHIVFMREHNRIAKRLGEIHPNWQDEQLFQEAKKIVTAEMQHIVYHEFLPAWLDESIMDKYRLTVPTPSYDYEPETNPTVISSFGIAARGHSMVPQKFKFFDQSYQPVGDVLGTEETYLHPHFLLWKNYNAINDIARWVVGEQCPMADRFVAGAMRNKLFPFGYLSFDILSLNIMRGRDWGVPPYLQFWTEVCEMPEVTTWDDLKDEHHNADVIDLLSEVYDSPSDIDLYVGILTETVLGESMTGPTAACLIGIQMEALKYGDIFWYETRERSSDNERLGFTDDQLGQLRKATLSRILCDNLDLEDIQANVFRLDEPRKECSSHDDIPVVDLDAWS